MAYLSKGFLIEFFFFFNYKVSDEFVSICALLGIIRAISSFWYQQSSEKIIFFSELNFMKLTSTDVTNTIFFR